jgi:hypothetical protein
VEAIAETSEAAFAEAQTKLPHNAEVLEKKVITSPKRKTITVEAFDEQIAMAISRLQANSLFGNSGIVKSMKLIVGGSKGFLGIGKKPHRYEAELLQQAKVEITYRPKVKIAVKIGDLYKSKAKISMKISDKFKETQLQTIEELVLLKQVFSDISPESQQVFKKRRSGIFLNSAQEESFVSLVLFSCVIFTGKLC